MKKMMSTAAVMVALAGTVMFTSCGKSDLYDANLVNEKTVKSYEQQFIEAFGPVSENQSWDFTASAKASTRGDVQSTVVWNTKQHGNNFFAFVDEDFEGVKEQVESAAVVDWKPYASMIIHPVYAKGTGDDYAYHTVGVKFNGQDKLINYLFTVNAKDNTWYSGLGKAPGTNNLNFNTGREIDSEDMMGVEGFFWYAVVTPSATNASGIASDAEIWNNLEQHKLTTCKMFTVNGRQYVAFDCNGDKDYSDLICLLENYQVKEAEIVKTEAKRYMMEDLGSVGDFDFNDCVVDLTKTTWSDGKVETKGVVRALGGKLDIAILIGGKQVWAKSAQEGLDVKTMYNTTNINKSNVYGEFDASDWQPSDNNISFAVKGENAQDITTMIEFPKTGTIPQMVAVKADHDWMSERTRVPRISWFE
ncbi:hypothetical protein [Prevotella sp. ne3005]|uniref:hypothetical protein n=1 Tax=Prevotella sp. ne3005 TaxID=1761887 RepID=UPI0011144FA8|nr:hypothetical protein [Prevotella sp. ne3005]